MMTSNTGATHPAPTEPDTPTRPTPVTEASPSATSPLERSARPAHLAHSLAPGRWRPEDVAREAAIRAHAAAPRASAADVDAAVDAAMLAQAHIAADSGPRNPRQDRTTAARAATVAETTARATTATQRHTSDAADSDVDWSGSGLVVPVLAASPGAGASVTAAVIADAAQLAGLSVLMVDTADPSRSGLARATVADGPQVLGPHPTIRIRFSWRAQALLARVDTTLPVLAPGMLPPPQFWRPGPRHLDITVVDIGHDPWRITAHPLTGAGMWLRHGHPTPVPILAVRPSVPSLAHAEQLLARLEPWTRLGAATTPAQLVVVGVRRWPSTVVATAGRRVQKLLANAIFLRQDPDLAAHGVTAEVTPHRVRSAVLPMLHRFGLTTSDKPSQPRSSGLRVRARGKGGRGDDRAHRLGLADPTAASTTTTV